MENQYNPFAVIDRRLENIETLLLEIKHGSQKNDQPLTVGDSDELLTAQQTADFLDLSKASVYGLVHAGKIPGACKRGKRLYFSKQELTDWIKSGRKQTAAELTAKAEHYTISQTKKRRG